MAETARDTNLSRKLAWLLRHGAIKEGLQFIDGCFLNVDDILRHRQFSAFTSKDIERVVSVDSKKRYEIRVTAEGRQQIRAVQGHSVKVDGLDLVPITMETSAQYPAVVHGTYSKHWGSIAKHGLRRMNRTHIHFAASDVCGGSDGVEISGLRRSAEILIYVDLPRALADGFEFSVSRNNVILCEGDQTGALPAAYFKEVWKLRPYRLLIFADGQPQE